MVAVCGDALASARQPRNSVQFAPWERRKRRFHPQTRLIITMLVIVLLIGTAVAVQLPGVVMARDALRKETRMMRFSESLCPRLAGAGAGLGRWLIWSAAVAALTIAGCGRNGSVTPLYPVEGQSFGTASPSPAPRSVFCPREESAAKDGVSPRAHTDANGRFPPEHLFGRRRRSRGAVCRGGQMHAGRGRGRGIGARPQHPAKEICSRSQPICG